MDKEQKLDISWLTIAKVFIAVIIFYFIYLTKEIALWFFFALTISFLLEPAINFFRRFRIPRLLAVLFVYLSVFGILGFLIYLTAPLFVFELKEFSQRFPDYFIKISPFLRQIGIESAQTFDNFTQFLVNWFNQSSKGLISAILVFFGGLSSTLFILTASFFLSLEDSLEEVLRLVLPLKQKDGLITILKRSQRKISGWFGARIIACLFVGLASFIVFYIFGIKYSFLLALISGFLNFIPYIGPLLTTVLLIIFVAISSASWFALFYILLAFFVIQQVENSLLTPLLMKKFVNVPPVLVLVSLFVGAKLFGFLGTIFAVPVFGVIYEFIKEFLEKRKRELEKLEQ